jgi:hypothetical protein
MSDISVINILFFIFKYFEILPGTRYFENFAYCRHCDVGRRGTCDVHTRVLAPLARHVVSINYQ